MVALALSLRPLGPPPMPARVEAREPAHFSRPSRAVQTPHKLPGLASGTCKVFLLFNALQRHRQKFPSSNLAWLLKNKKATTASSCSPRAGCLFPWLIECREQGPVAEDPRTRGCYVSLQPQTSTALWPNKLSGKLMSVSMPGWRARLFATLGYCVLRETGFQNTRPLAFSPCHPVWNIKCRLQWEMPIATRTKRPRMFFWITVHIYYGFSRIL